DGFVAEAAAVGAPQRDRPGQRRHVWRWGRDRWLYPGEVMDVLRIREAVDTSRPAETGQRDDQVVQSRAAAQQQIASIQVNHDQMPIQVREQVHNTGGANTPAPRLGAV